MDEQALGAELDERQRAQAGEQVGGVLVGEHRLQQRQRGAAHDGRGVECAPGDRLEPVDVQAGELLDHRPDDGVLGRERRAFGERSGGELQRQRVAVREGRDPGGGATVRLRCARAARARPRPRGCRAGTTRSSSPRSRRHAAGPSRPAITTRTFSGRPGTSSCRSHASSSRRRSWASMARTTRPSWPSSASPSAVRNPRSVGSNVRPSSVTTVAPRARASAAAARSSVDLPTPAIPCTNATIGVSRSTRSSSAARSRPRPTSATRRSSSIVCSVRGTVRQAYAAQLSAGAGLGRGALRCVMRVGCSRTVKSLEDTAASSGFDRRAPNTGPRT